MINTFFIAGDIKKINISEPKDPSKSASAVILVQYGPQRESSGGAVEFVNAVMIRIPSYKFPALRGKIKVGQKVTVHGHLQGVFKNVMDEGYFTTELVADRVTVDSVESTEAE